MASLKQSNIFNINFITDEKLNIVSFDRSFLRYFNVTEAKNLKDYITSFDLDFLTDELKSKDSFSLSLRITAREELHNCYISVNKKGNGYEFLLIDLDNSLNIFNSNYLNNLEYKSILKNNNIDYFIYCPSNNSVVFKKTSSEEITHTCKLENLKDYLISFLSLDSNNDISNLQLNDLINDLNNNSIKKSYNLLMSNNYLSTINLSSFMYYNEDYILGYISADTPYKNENNHSEQMDGLTNVYNKVSITNIAKKNIDIKNNTSSILIIDIDNFKDFNDNFGHQYGDMVLINVAKILRETVNGIGFAGRIGGDEFMCIVNTNSEEDLRNITRNIKLGIQWSLTANSPDAIVTCSIGAARYPLNGNSYDEIFSLADKSLYIAKNKGRNCYVIYKPEIHDSVFIANNKINEKMKTGQFYYDECDIWNKALSLIPTDKNAALLLIKDYLLVNKITVYNNKNELITLIGDNDKNVRESFLKKDNYFKYYNDYDYLVMNNVNVLDTLDKEYYDMYLSDNIATTAEIRIKNKGLICFDKFKPAKTFTKSQITFIILFTKEYFK